MIPSHLTTLAIVQGEVKIAHEQRRRAEERELSKFTLDSGDEAYAEGTHAVSDVSFQCSPSNTHEKSMLSFRELIDQYAVKDRNPAKLRAAEVAMLPRPLTRAVLEHAYKELGVGAEQSIEACLQCWRQEKLGTDELLITLKSFASQSTTLQRHLACIMPSVEGEVATVEQMRELTEMMYQ